MQTIEVYPGQCFYVLEQTSPPRKQFYTVNFKHLPRFAQRIAHWIFHRLVQKGFFIPEDPPKVKRWRYEEAQGVSILDKVLCSIDSVLEHNSVADLSRLAVLVGPECLQEMRFDASLENTNIILRSPPFHRKSASGVVTTIRGVPIVVMPGMKGAAVIDMHRLHGL